MSERLKSLVVNEKDANEEILATVLSDYTQIGGATGDPMFKPKYSTLKAEGKILVYLLARKVAVALLIFKGAEAAAPKEIASATGLPPGTVKPAVASLARRGLLHATDGRYSVPNHLLLRVKEEIR